MRPRPPQHRRPAWLGSPMVPVAAWRGLLDNGSFRIRMLLVLVIGWPRLVKNPPPPGALVGSAPGLVQPNQAFDGFGQSHLARRRDLGLLVFHAFVASQQ